MRRLILIRHAHALPAADGQSDRDRPLSELGIREADAAGLWLRDSGRVADRVLVSPAVRTQQTAHRIAMHWPAKEVQQQADIYEATVGELIALLDDHAEVNTLALVGHNPGLERLVALLCSGQSGDFRGMPPAGIAVLWMHTNAAIEPGIAGLDAFWWP